MGTPTSLTVEEVKGRRDSGAAVTFVDARNPQAWASATAILPGAVRVPADEVDAHLGLIPRVGTVIPYCT